MAKDLNKTENIAYKTLIEPWITEAATMMAEANKYVFKVAMKSTKPEIRKSIENLYNVTVKKVHTIHIPKKARNRGRIQGWKSGFKKAIVTVKEGESIDVFGGK